jgi:perosamine synthetase
LHPYYAEQFGWHPEDLPAATALWERLVTLPLFPALRDDEQLQVVDVVRALCDEHRR